MTHKAMCLESSYDFLQHILKTISENPAIQESEKLSKQVNDCRLCLNDMIPMYDEIINENRRLEYDLLLLREKDRNERPGLILDELQQYISDVLIPRFEKMKEAGFDAKMVATVASIDGELYRTQFRLLRMLFELSVEETEEIVMEVAQYKHS